MALSKINPTKMSSWKKLVQQFDKEFDYHISDLFKEENDRLEKFSISWNNFYLDFSKNRLSKRTSRLTFHRFMDKVRNKNSLSIKVN